MAMCLIVSPAAEQARLSGLSAIFNPRSKNFLDQVQRDRGIFAGKSISHRLRAGLGPISKAKHHRFASEEAKAGAFA